LAPDDVIPTVKVEEALAKASFLPVLETPKVNVELADPCLVPSSAWGVLNSAQETIALRGTLPDEVTPNVTVRLESPNRVALALEATPNVTEVEALRNTSRDPLPETPRVKVELAEPN
jgi:hypothetical protein